MTASVSNRVAASLQRRARGDDGSYTVEMVLWTPVLALLLVVIVAAGRIVAAGSDATEAARDAARAASLQTAMPQARQAARQAARASFSQQGDTCHKLSVTVSGSVVPGGLVTVTVSCTASLSDLAIPGAPGHRTLSSSSTAPIENTRSAGQP